MKLAKVMCMWVGEPLAYYESFKARMNKFSCLDWGMFPDTSWSMYPRHVTAHEFNNIMSDRLGCLVRKTKDSCPDARPAFGEAFQKQFKGYEWWGWSDLDIVMGDLDNLLPPLLDGDHDVLTFIDGYLSGLAFLRNNETTRTLWRRHKLALDVMKKGGRREYMLFDNSGLPDGPSFYQVIQEAGLKVKSVPDCWSYSTLKEPKPVRLEGNKLLCDGKEVLFHHFKDNAWPIK